MSATFRNERAMAEAIIAGEALAFSGKAYAFARRMLRRYGIFSAALKAYAPARKMLLRSEAVAHG